MTDSPAQKCKYVDMDLVDIMLEQEHPWLVQERLSEVVGCRSAIWVRAAFWRPDAGACAMGAWCAVFGRHHWNGIAVSSIGGSFLSKFLESKLKWWLALLCLRWWLLEDHTLVKGYVPVQCVQQQKLSYFCVSGGKYENVCFGEWFCFRVSCRAEGDQLGSILWLKLSSPVLRMTRTSAMKVSWTEDSSICSQSVFIAMKHDRMCSKTRSACRVTENIGIESVSSRASDKETTRLVHIASWGDPSGKADHAE